VDRVEDEDLPVKSRAASTAWLANRTTSAPSMTGRCENRSATAPPSSSAAIVNAVRVPSTHPSAADDPVTSSTANASATATIPSPNADVSWPMKNRRYVTERSGASESGMRIRRQELRAIGEEERTTGLEPATFGLGSQRSTS
jgi:hypothetical protein